MAKFSNKCSSCGYTLTFDPEKQTLLCSHCGARAIIKSQTCSDKKPYNSLVKVAKNEQSSARFECVNCGAKTNNSDVVTGVCPYCGSADVKALAKSIMFFPDAIVPFAVSKKQAKAKYKEWIKTKKFVPSNLKSSSKLNKMEGMYFPCWNFGLKTASTFSGVGIKEHTTTSVVSGSHGPRVVSHTHVTRHPFTRSRTDDFNDLLINANSQIDAYELEKLGNYGLSELKVFNPAYLLGFESSGYEIDVHKGMKAAKNVAQTEINENAKNSTGYSRIENFSIDTKFLSQTYSYIYLPVWVCNFIYKHQTYKFLVNGFSGFVHGKVPRSPWKILGLVLGIAAVIGIVALLIALFK